MAELVSLWPIASSSSAIFQGKSMRIKKTNRESHRKVLLSACCVRYLVELILQLPGVLAAESSHLGPFPRTALIQSATPSPGRVHIQHQCEVTKAWCPWIDEDISEEPSSSRASQRLAETLATSQSASPSAHPVALSLSQVLSPKPSQ